VAAGNFFEKNGGFRQGLLASLPVIPAKRQPYIETSAARRVHGAVGMIFVFIFSNSQKKL
jgi:hypothetical protein